MILKFLKGIFKRKEIIVPVQTIPIERKDAKTIELESQDRLMYYDELDIFLNGKRKKNRIEIKPTKEEVFDTLKNQMISKYADDIFTRDGEYNLTTLRKIAGAVGLKQSYVRKDKHLECTYIYDEIIDPHGGKRADGVASALKFCLYIKNKYEN